jgi:PAS domain S-box-containing protein
LSDARPEPAGESIFQGDGEMAVRCRGVDWGATSLGPVESWAPALRFAVRTTMECPSPISLWCGEDKVLIYNDAYRAVLGSRHPGALARPGSEAWPDALSPIRDEDGRIIAYLDIASETTRHVEIQQALRQARAEAEHAERRLQDVFAQAPGILAVLKGPQHEFEFVNASCMQLVGHHPVLGLTIPEAMPEVVGHRFIDLLDLAYHTGKAFVRREVALALQRVPQESPQERFIDFVFQPIADVDGKTSGIVVHGADVSEGVMARGEIERLLLLSEQARARTEESEARYRFLANAIPVQVWTATPEGQLDFVSESAAEYFGATDDDLLGHAWMTRLHTADVAPTAERWARSLATGEPYEMEFRLRKADGADYRWFLARATAQRDEEGRILRWFGTSTDIEHHRRTEAELERLTREAMEASRAKSDFLTAMSHELRTPLNAIGGYAQLIELGVRGPITEEQRVDLSRIQRSKDYLNGLIGDVLDFAKAGAGRMEYHKECILLNRTLDSVREMIAPQLAEKKLRFESTDIPVDFCAIADEDRTRQILLNLFSNALKFTASGGTISLAVSRTETYVVIAVADTGTGIPPEQIESIFEPFVQAGRSLRPSDQGVGLGLAISRKFARAMGGDLVVESEVGRGSTFTLSLPRC